MKFSIWYNQKNDFLTLMERYKDNLSSIYFPLPYSVWNSGRNEIQQENYEDNTIFTLIKKCKEYNIESILIINSTCEWENTGNKHYLLKLIKYIKPLYENWLTSLTLTNPLYLPFIKKFFPNLIIYSSVNCYLRTYEQAIFFKNLGFNVLTIDRDINRDLELIQKIKNRTGIRLQMLVNEWCFSGCPYRQIHFNMAAHKVDYNISDGSSKDNLIENFSCVPMVNKNKKLIFRVPFVRPEDLKYYDNLIDIYKLDTRSLSSDRIALMLNAYIEEKYEWDLKDIVDFPYQNVPFIDNKKLTKLLFFKKILKCPKDCDNCNICNQFF